MIEALARSGNELALSVAQRCHRLAPDCDADAREGNSQILSHCFDLAALGRRRGKRELVIVAAGEQTLRCERLVRAGGDRLCARQALPTELGADAGGLENVAEVAEQAVGDVDGSVRQSAQPSSQLDLRLGRMQAREASLARGAFELQQHPGTPFKVVVNEAVELGKSFGGTGGHKYVNGVLDKLASQLRPDERRA